MDVKVILAAILIGAISGFAAYSLVTSIDFQKGPRSLVKNIIIGIVGAFIGYFIYDLLKLGFGTWVSYLAMAIVAITLVTINGIVSNAMRKR